MPVALGKAPIFTMLLGIEQCALPISLYPALLDQLLLRIYLAQFGHVIPSVQLCVVYDTTESAMHSHNDKACFNMTS